MKMRDMAEFFSQPEPPPPTTVESIFEEEPVSLDVFIRDKKYLGSDWNLSPIQAASVRTIERIYLPSLYPEMAREFGGYWAEPVPMKNLITLQWGKGSGKDHVCRISSLRVAYLLLCLKSPLQYFDMPEDDSIHLLNIAANSAQANRAFFTPLTKSVKRGWFADKADPKRDSIQYAKNIESVSGHSDAEGQEGLNILLGVADEIDAFKAKDEMVGQGKRAREASTSAESILKMLKGSASTRFPESYKRVAISYPRYKGSTIQRLTAEAEDDIQEVGPTSIYFASGPYATWDVNPRIKGKESFASDYRRNPVEAAAMYECKPHLATDPYFRNFEIFKQAIDAEEQPLTVDYELENIRSKRTGSVQQVWTPKFEFAPDFRPVQGARYALHGDLAIRGDRAGIAMAHVERWEYKKDILQDEEGGDYEVSTYAPHVKVDFVISFSANTNVQPEREIQIRWARALAYLLIKRGFMIDRFTFDGFQSTDSMQILEMHGIKSEKVSADRTDDVWMTLRDVASDGRLKMPYDELLLTELGALSRIGGKVDHPPHGSKDLADALACAVTGAVNAGGEEDVDGTEVEVGATYFDLGDALTPLEGLEDMEWIQPGGAFAPLLGMKEVQRDEYGW